MSYTDTKFALKSGVPNAGTVQRVINNLWCVRDTVLYPFGAPTGLPPEAAIGPLVQIFPNPSADGRFMVRLGAGAGTLVLTVVGALGRMVARRLLTAGQADTFLDLRTQAPGFYAARLRWPDGRTVTRRLVRAVAY